MQEIIHQKYRERERKEERRRGGLEGGREKGREGRNVRGLKDRKEGGVDTKS